MKQDTDATCLLCHTEDQDGLHFIHGNPKIPMEVKKNVDPVHPMEVKKKVEDLHSMYTEEE